MLKILALAVVFPLTLFANTFENDMTQECYGRTTARPWAYCLTKPKVRENPDILYFIHGAGDNEKTWFEDYDDIRTAWRALGKPIPTVISFSFAPVWLMVKKNEFKTSGLLKWIPETLIPKLEAEAGGLGPNGKRLILSKSMGGYNSIQLMFNYPSMFSRIVLISPAVVSHSPFDKKALDAFVARTGANRNKAFWTSVLFRSFFPTPELWFQASPYYATPSFLTGTAPELYVSVGTKDTWGFYEGAKYFAQSAVTNGVKVTLEEIPGGGHHEYNAVALAKFLVP